MLMYLYCFESETRPYARTPSCTGIDNAIDHWDKSDIVELRKNMLHLTAQIDWKSKFR